MSKSSLCIVVCAEASIREEVARCRDAISEGDVQQLEMAALSVAGRSRRVVEVSHLELRNSDDPQFCSKLQTATARLEAGLIQNSFRYQCKLHNLVTYSSYPCGCCLLDKSDSQST